MKENMNLLLFILRVMSHSPFLAIKVPFMALILTLLGYNSVRVEAVVAVTRYDAPGSTRIP